MALLKALARCQSVCRPRILTALCLGLVEVFSLASGVQAAQPSEYQVKAAFLFNFVKFVEWPPNAFPNASTPFVIGVLGRDPFGTHLEDIVRGERVNSRPLIVERYRQTGEIKNCHVLFVSRSESDRLDSIVGNLKYRTILIVTDADGGNGGVMIRFVNEGSRIRFKIDAQAAKAANLTISSKLLRLG